MGVSLVAASRHLRLETQLTHWWEVGALTTAPPLFPNVHLLDKPKTGGQLYFPILIILFPLLDHFQCSLFHISMKKCNQRAMETCFFKE